MAAFVSSLNIQQTEFLMAHIDGPQPCWAFHQNTTKALIDRKLIRYVQRHTSRPQHTEATDAGRRQIAAILARTAERLIQAGCLEPSMAEFLTEASILGKLAKRPDISPGQG